ncbi:MAG: zinc-dependent metalloprotease family protein [Pseudomonadota bacterium]
MTNNRFFAFCLSALVFVLLPTITNAVEPIKVLLVRTPSASAGAAIAAMSQINLTLANSQLAALKRVQSARQTEIGTAYVYQTTCNAADDQMLLSCVESQLGSERDNFAADVVLVVTAIPVDAGCGAVFEDTINRVAIGVQNNRYGYMVVEQGCIVAATRGQKVASHEFGHILNLEHIGDPEESTPRPDNHAIKSGDGERATVMAHTSECKSGCEWVDYFSEVPRVFPDASPAGHISDANGKIVVDQESWAAVAAYRPIAQQACVFELRLCSEGYNNTSVTVSWPGNSLVYTEYEKELPTGVIYDVYEGPPSCPFIDTGGDAVDIIATVRNVYGAITSCRVTLAPDICGDGGFVW